MRRHHAGDARPRRRLGRAPARRAPAARGRARGAGSSRWLSTAVSPWPGKCFAQAATPSRPASPALKATAWRATSPGSREKLRSPITGFAGFVSTSATGAKSRSTRRSASSRPSARATACGVGRRAALAEPAHRRPLRPRRAQPLHAPALLIDRHAQRRVSRRPLVQLGHQCAQLLGRVDVAGEEHDAPDAPVRVSARRDRPAAPCRRSRRRGADPVATAMPRRTPYTSWPMRRGARGPPLLACRPP